jgi:hypothetical protein
MVACYLYAGYLYAVNVPVSDDYTLWIKGSIVMNEGSWGDKVRWLLKYHNGHYIALPKLFVCLSVSIFGALDFRAICISCLFFSVLSFCLILYCQSRFKHGLILPALCTAMCLFGFGDTQNIIWATGGVIWLLGHFLVILLFALVVQGRRWSDIVGVICGFGMVFTSASGLIALFGVCVLLLLRKEWTRLLLYGSGFLICAMIYVYLMPDVSADLYRGGQIDVKGVLLYFFCFIGNIGFSNSVSLWVGVVLLVFLVFGTFDRSIVRNDFVFLLLVYGILNAVVIAGSRWGYGVDGIRYSRYAIISIYLFVACFLWLLEFRKRYHVVLLSVMISVTGLAYVQNLISQFDSMKVHRARCLHGAYLLEEYGISERMIHPVTTYAAKVLMQGVESGLYFPQSLDFDGRHQAWMVCRSTSENTGKVRATTEVAFEDDRWLYVRGWAFLEEMSSQNSIVFIVLQSEVSRIEFLPFMDDRSDLNSYFEESLFDYKRSGYHGVIDKNLIPVGRYRLGVSVDSIGVSGVKYFEKFVDID